ncbi:MAG: carboxypeptidase-like regulatory domain-containing protein [Pyrinomonadaceae bacterium]
MQKDKCQCQSALEDDYPHGANEEIEIRGGTVKSIRGKVIYPNGEPKEGAVVEVYSYASSDKNLRPYELVREKKRIAACLTDENGRFCFTGLPSGKYVVRAGTRISEGMQEIYVVTSVERHWWRRWRSKNELNIRLELGW